MAQYLLQNRQWVRGKRVLDFGSGSRVVAIAAAMAGAATVYACDIDPDAVLATRCNVQRNQVDVSVFSDFNDIIGEVDLIIVADVLYDRANLPWLSRFLERAPDVLVADSRIKDFSCPGYSLLATMDGTTVPDLDEFDEFKTVRLYHGKRIIGAG